MVPMLALGVPGSGTTAIILGALLMFAAPGPQLFPQSPTFVWGVIGSFYTGNVILVFLNLPPPACSRSQRFRTSGSTCRSSRSASSVFAVAIRN